MDIIKFPEDDIMETRFDHKHQDGLGNKFGGSKQEVPESCKHQTYCTVKPPNYPEDKYNKLLKDYNVPPLPTIVALQNRVGLDGDNDCDSITSFEPIYYARRKREDGWKIVVNAPKHNYVQKVRLETCTSAGSSCFKAILENNPSFEAHCVQLEQQWEVMVESADGNGTEIIPIPLPACCSCLYKRIDIFTRFNIDAAKQFKSNKTKV